MNTETAGGAANDAGPAARGEKFPLNVRVVRGNVTRVECDVIVAGQYKGIAPVQRSAVGAMDEALDFWITDACVRSMLGGDLGDTFFVPTPPERMSARHILLAGMGEYGKFAYESLCYLSLNVTYAVLKLGFRRFASVLIGSGEGGLPVAEVVKGLLSGVCDALYHLEEEQRHRLEEFVIVELNPERVEEVLQVLADVRSEGAKKDPSAQSIGRLDINVTRDEVPSEPEPAAGRSGARDAARERTSQFVNRLNIERGESGFQYTALTDSAVIPVRRIEVQSFFTDGIAKQLARSDGEEQYEYGRLLHTYVFPEEFERFVAAKPYRPLTLVLDSTTASLPWEMACFDAPGERVNFGIHLMLSRQFRTTLAGAPGVAPPVNKSLRVLVIADPASDDADLKLEAARDEGWAVFDLFERLREERKGHIDIKVEKYIGAGECDPLRMLRLLFNNAYDIVHFSGHGLFDPRRPNRSGWVFGRNCVLSAREIFRARQVPRLVFANACFSSATKATSARAAARRQQQTTQKLAGMAEAFFERGVQNYIGAGWDVESAAAVKFSTEFYARAVGGTRLCEALAAARLSIFDTEDTNYRASWGAYQHYGQANTRLVP